MNVLSLFDGMSCGRIALERAGIAVENYYASEIDKYAIQVSRANYLDIQHVGDVTKLCGHYFYPCPDLILGGSPCQGFSDAGLGLGFADPRSKLFYEYVRILKEVRYKNPKVKFLLENVPMKKEWQDIITKELGVEPILINSALVSAQNRKRLYWTNIKGVSQPKDLGLYMKDILETPYSGFYDTGESRNGCIQIGIADDINGHDILKRIYSPEGKSPTLHTSQGGNTHPKVADENYLTPEQVQRGFHQASAKTWRSGKRMGKTDFPNTPHKKAKTLTVVATKGGRETNHVLDEHYYRRLTCTEYERLQNVPDGYTSNVSDSQRYKMLGNGWNVNTITHLLKALNEEIETQQWEEQIL